MRPTARLVRLALAGRLVCPCGAGVTATRNGEKVAVACPTCGLNGNYDAPPVLAR